MAAEAPAPLQGQLPREPTFARALSAKASRFVQASAKSFRRMLSGQRRAKRERRKSVSEGAEELFDVLPLCGFGEMALLTDLPRNASVTVVDTCELLVLTSEHFAVIKEAAAEKYESMVQTLSRTPCLQPLSDQHLKAMVAHLVEREYPAGVELWPDRMHALTFIIGGTAQACRLKDELREEGRDGIRRAREADVRLGGKGDLREGLHFEALRRLEAGAFFGESGVFSDMRSGLLVKAGAKLRVLQCAAGPFRAELSACPPEAQRAVKELMAAHAHDMVAA